ncbi:MAG: ABC transporter substrate-binding protein [Oscillospiraceae bacterium]
MKNKKIIGMTIVASMVASIFTGCGEKTDTIKIGGLAPLSGNVSMYGISTSNGYKLAVEDINKNGGILGKQVELVLEDEEGDQTKAINAYNKLVGNGVAGIVGDVTSKPTTAVAKQAADEGIPMITPTSTAADVTTYGDNIFRSCYLDPFQGGTMAKYAKEKLNISKTAILYDSADDYSIGIAEAYKKTCEEIGIEVTAMENFQDSTATVDFKSQLTKIKETNPEAIFVPTYYNAIALITTQAQQLGLEDAIFIGCDGWDGVVEALDKNNINIVDGAYFANHYFTGDDEPIVKDFLNKYEETFGEKPTAFSALGYDATMMLAKAIEEAGTTDYAAVTEAMKNIDYNGVTGNRKFGGNGDPVKSITVITIENGQYKLADKYSA